MGWWDAMVRRVRIRGLQEGLVQRGRVEAMENSAADDAERFQDYGFSAHPVDGQGLQIEVGGHTLIIRMDRLAERPQLAEFEVAVWHKEGHMVRLRAGKVVQVDCDSLVINAAEGVTINSPTVQASGIVTAPTVAATSSLTVRSKEMHLHAHGGVSTGSSTSGPPA